MISGKKTFYMYAGEVSFIEHMFLQLANDRQVGRQDRVVVEFAGTDPAVFGDLQVADGLAPRRGEVGEDQYRTPVVAVEDDVEDGVDADLQVELFQDLPLQADDRIFPRQQLAAGKFPLPGMPAARRAAGDEDFPGA